MWFINTPISFIIVSLEIGLGVALYMEKLDFYDIYFNKYLILEKHQFWRLFTSCAVYSPTKYNDWIQLLFNVRYLFEVESKYFTTRPLDFILFILYTLVGLWILGFFFPISSFTRLFPEALFYYALKRDPFNLLVMFVIPMNAFSWIGLLLILENDFYQRIGILLIFIISHIYFFLHDVINLKFETRFFVLPDSLNLGLYKLLSLGH